MQVKLPQLHVLHDCILKQNGDVTKAVQLFVSDYVLPAYRDTEFWTGIAKEIKADPEYIEKFAAEQKAKQ